MPERNNQPASRLRQWLAELRRRRVPRVAAAYLIVGWAVVEVADTVFPYLGLPEAAVTLVIALVALGLPLALVLSWAFEVSPEGVRQDERPDPAPAEPAARSRKSLPLLALVAAAFLAGGVAWWHRAPTSTRTWSTPVGCSGKSAVPAERRTLHRPLGFR